MYPNPPDFYAALGQLWGWNCMVGGTSPRMSSGLVGHTLKFSLQIPHPHHKPGSLLCPPVSLILYIPGLTVGFISSWAQIKLPLNPLGQLESEMQSHVLFLKLHQVWLCDCCPRDIIMFSIMLCRCAFASAQEAIRISVAESKCNLEGRHIASHF